MSDIYFNKNAGAPKKPVRKNDGKGEYEDISSYSDNYRDEYDDIASGNGKGDIEFGKARPVGAGRNGQAGQPARTGQSARRSAKAGAGGRQNGVSARQTTAVGDELPKKKRRRRRNPFLRAFTSVLIAVIILVGIGAAALFGILGKIDYTPAEDGDRVNPYISETELYSSDDVTNILLIGVDAREGETVSRSDTMMLISLDKANKKIKMTSFLRDSYVEIPDNGWNKLNAASSKGGEDLVMNTIEYNFKVKIDHYMLVDFNAFETLIDAIGGINVEVTEKEANYLNRTWAQWSLTGNPLTFEAGEAVPLNGEQALMFCRIRKLDSDFYRTERQRRVISAVKNKVMASPFNLIDIANSVLPLVETDIPQSEMMSLCLGAAFSYIKFDTAQQSIPADGTWHSERKSCGDSLVFDIDENAKILKDFIYFDIYEGKEETSTDPAA